MENRFIVLLIFVLALPLLTVNAWGETLDDFEKPYRESTTDEIASPKEPGDTDPLEKLGEEIMGNVLLGIGDLMVPDPGREFQPTPYNNPRKPPWKPSDVHLKGYNPMTFESSMNYLFVSDDISGGAFSGRLRTGEALSFRGSYSLYREELSGGGHDELSYGQIHGGPDLSIGSLMLSPGLGIANLHGDESHSGFSYGMEIEWLPLKPFVVNGSTDHSIVAGQDLIDYRVSLGLNFKHLDVTAGYRSLRNTDNLDLSGPTLGFNLRF